jgi:hypothetical protein
VCTFAVLEFHVLQLYETYWEMETGFEWDGWQTDGKRENYVEKHNQYFVCVQLHSIYITARITE